MRAWHSGARAQIRTKVGAPNAAVVALLLLVAAAAAAPPVFREDGSFTFPPAVTRGMWFVEDGKTKQPLGKDRDIALLHSVAKTNGAVLWTVQILNREKAPCWLRLTLNLETSLSTPLRYWDGLKDHSVEKQPISHTELNNSTFPLAALYDQRSGFAVGLEASQNLSFAESAATPGKRPKISYGTKIVVEPGQTETLKFVLFPFQPGFGYLDAVEFYYDLFPDRFRPHPQIDPRVLGGSAGGHSNPLGYWNCGPYPELLRRCRASVEWCYGPWRRAGDFYGEDALWDFEPVKGHNVQSYVQWQMPAPQYREYRAKNFANGKPTNQAMMFYVVNAIEEKLSESFLDSLLLPRSTFGTWPYETEYRAFSYGGKFGEKFHRDMQRVAEENYISGFAFDSSGGMGNRKYRGPLLRDLPAKAFDDEGPYVLEGVGIGRNLDFIHTIPVLGGRYKAAGWINPGGEHPMAYMMMFRADRSMVEWPTINAYDSNMGELLRRHRLLMGQKPVAVHAGLRADKFGSQIDWQKYPPEKIVNLYRMWWRHEIVACLYFGMSSYPERLWGVPEMFQIQKMIFDLEKRGWRAVPAARTDGAALCSRFGKGLQTAICFGNPTTNALASEATIEDGTLLFAEYDGKEFGAKSARGKTRFPLKLQPASWLVLDAVMKVETREAFEYAASEERDAQSGQIVVKNTGRKRVTGVFTPRIPEGYELDTFVVPPSGGASGIPPEGGTTYAALAPGESLAVTYRSSTIRSPVADICAFPFVANARPNCSIVLPANADEDARLAASWIRGYFFFWHRFGVEPATEVEIPIVESTASSGSSPKVILQVGGSPNVRVTDGNLNFTAPDSYALKELVWNSLSILDARYPYLGKFHADMKLWIDRDRFDYDRDTLEMLHAVGLLGKDKPLDLGRDKTH